MESYIPPSFLKERYPSFEQRWDLRDQFIKITGLMDKNEIILKNIPQDHPNYILSQNLIKEMEGFRYWSWREVDRDDSFYKKIQEFDERTFMIFFTPSVDSINVQKKK